MRETERAFRRRLAEDVVEQPSRTLARAQAEFRRDLWLIYLTSPLGRLTLWLAERLPDFCCWLGWHSPESWYTDSTGREHVVCANCHLSGFTPPGGKTTWMPR